MSETLHGDAADEEAANAEATELDEEDLAGTDSGHFEADQVEQLNARLERRLIKTKEGKGLYLETYTVVNHLNRIFGYGSWSRTVDAVESEEGPDGILYVARVTLSVRAPDGSISRHQDEGATLAPRQRDATSNATIRASSRRTARLGAISDGLKRAARSFGEQFANSLYDKTYMQTRDAQDREAARASAQAQRTENATRQQAGAARTNRAGLAVVREPVSLEALRSQVTRYLADDTEGAEKLPKPPAEMNEAELSKTLAWLQRRAEAHKKGETFWTGKQGAPAAPPAQPATTPPPAADDGLRRRELSGYVDTAQAWMEEQRASKGPMKPTEADRWRALYAQGQLLTKITSPAPDAVAGRDFVAWVTKFKAAAVEEMQAGPAPAAAEEEPVAF